MSLLKQEHFNMLWWKTVLIPSMKTSVGTELSHMWLRKDVNF